MSAYMARNQTIVYTRVCAYWDVYDENSSSPLLGAQYPVVSFPDKAAANPTIGQTLAWVFLITKFGSLQADNY